MKLLNPMATKSSSAFRGSYGRQCGSLSAYLCLGCGRGATPTTTDVFWKLWNRASASNPTLGKCTSMRLVATVSTAPCCLLIGAWKALPRPLPPSLVTIRFGHLRLKALTRGRSMHRIGLARFYPRGLLFCRGSLWLWRAGLNGFGVEGLLVVVVARAGEWWVSRIRPTLRLRARLGARLWLDPRPPGQFPATVDRRLTWKRRQQ